MELLLNLTIYLPALAIALLLLVRSDQAVRQVSLVATTLTFFCSLPLLFNFDIANSHLQQYLTEGAAILPGFDIKYLVGLDGLSLLLFMLTTLFGPIVILSSWSSVQKHLKGYYSMLLLLQTASLGLFASLDLIVFYVFFELSLIPMYFLIGIWGGTERIQATLKFFIYTLTGSLIMLVALLYLGYHAGTFHPDFLFTVYWRFISSSSYHIGVAEQKIGRASCRERVSS